MAKTSSNESPRFDHQAVDAKWQERWRKDERYRASDSPKDPMYILDMFPYPSGEGLHVGHPLGYIGTDILARYYRAQGKDVLHPMGFDSFGLPAEGYAIKTGIHPEETTTKAIARYKKQLEIIGLSYDWSRQLATSDPAYYRWTQWLFLKLYEAGLAYRATAPVNWCPHCQTVLANEQVVNGVCERCDTEVVQKELAQWFFKTTAYADELLRDLEKLEYPPAIMAMQRNWIGQSEGAEFDFALFDSQHQVTVFTTRPDTLMGVTYLVIAPEHPLLSELGSTLQNAEEVQAYVSAAQRKTELERKSDVKQKTGVELEGVYAIHPITNERLPIWVADYVLASYGTGAIMAVPAHDERDHAFARQFDLPIRHVIEPAFRASGASDSAVQEGKPFVQRELICAVVRNPKDDTYLCIQWKDVKMNGLVTGGIDQGEDPIVAARREIYEETGYKNLRLMDEPRWTINTFFYHRLKNVNRHAHFTYVFFELENEERDTVAEHEAAQHDVVWKKAAELKDFFTVFEGDFLVKILNNPDYVYTGSGILINSGEFTGQTSDDARVSLTEVVGGTLKTVYRLRDWLVSRQRYWGTPIPMILCEEHGYVPVPLDQLPVTLPHDVDFAPTGESPLAHSESFHKGVICPTCGKPARREVDTMDTFVDSSWYFLRYADPQNSQEIFDPQKIANWLPVDWYVGGAEHAVLHLLYARFFTKALADMGLVSFREPFLRLRNQGLIGGEDGRKMSKRWGNVVNPDDVVRSYGADALRTFEMFMGPFEEAKPWSMQGLVGVRRWLERVFRLQVRVGEGELQKGSASILHQSIQKISHDILNFQFNTAVSQLMILTNALETERCIPHDAWRSFLQLLTPFAPHLGHELWEIAGFAGFPDEAWPVFDAMHVVVTEVSIPVQINGKVRASLVASPDLSQDEVLDRARQLTQVQKYLPANVLPTKVIYIPGKILNIVL